MTTAAQAMMMADGNPPECVMTAEERQAAWRGRPTSPPITATTTTETEPMTTVISRLKSDKKPGAASSPLKRPLPERKANITKAKRQKTAAKAVKAVKATKAKPVTTATAMSVQASAKAAGAKVTKQDELRTFLTGTVRTVEEVQAKFGWLPHSARSAISRLGNVTKGETGTGQVTYTIKAKGK